MKLLTVLLIVLPLYAQTPALAPVTSKPFSRIVNLPGEFEPFLEVSVHARVAGYVERMAVDRGSVVRQGDLIAELSAPEMDAQIAEAMSRAQSADAERLQAEAQLAAAQASYEGLKKAAETPGAVAGNDVILAGKQVQAAEALVNSRRQAVNAQEAAIRALRQLQAYLKITAPFNGVVTDRLVHPGALVGPGNDLALVVIQQVSRLRLVVPVPEEDAGGIVKGASVAFATPAWPEKTFLARVARISHALDPKTRTMNVELDVPNNDDALAPGMFPTVKWPVRQRGTSLFVPKASVVTTTERTFVIRDQNGKAEWVDVVKGTADGDLIEVRGSLEPGDKVVRRATDEIREGTPIRTLAKSK